MPKLLPRLIAISNRHSLAGGSLDTWLEELGNAGVDAVQIREKDLSDRELYNLLRRAREILPESARILINGRLDLALAAGVDGVHLPSRGVPPASLRQRFGDGPLIGLSTHEPGEVLTAQNSGVDYVMFGPVYSTPSKTQFGPPPGLDGLRQAVAIGLPVFALGGVTMERLPDVAAAGAVGAAGISVFMERGKLKALVALAAQCFDRAEAK